MAKFCINCGRTRSFYDRLTYSDHLCNECAIALDNKPAELVELANMRPAEPVGRNAQPARDVAKVWLDKGISFHRLRSYRAAIGCFDKALEIDPRLALAWSSKGASLLNIGRKEEAIGCFDKALEIDPRLALAWSNKGVYLLNIGRYQEAIGCFDKALDVNPRFTSAWNNKGISLYRLGLNEEALQCLNKVLEIDPKNAGGWTLKGELTKLENVHKEREAVRVPVKGSKTENRTYTPQHFQEEQRQRRVNTVREIERMGIPTLNKHQTEAYIEAHRLLVADQFLEHCTKLVNDYHAGDQKLTQLLLRGALRASYSSTSALLHFATTGGTGSGKNDLINNVTALLPSTNVVMYSSVTSKVLYYAMRVQVSGTKKMVTNPDHFKNKIIVVTEIADSVGFSALKAFAELDEFSPFTHSTTIGAKEVDLTVRGPRALWITSVLSVQDDQVQRRFIHSQIEPEDEQKRNEKIDVVTAGLVNQRDIKTDLRLPICKAGFDLLFRSKPQLELPAQEVVEMVSDLNTMLTKEGCSVSQLKQLYALMECGAVERQFARKYTRVEKQDVLDGWYLSGFCNDKEVLLGGEWCKPTMEVGSKEFSAHDEVPNVLR